MTSKCISLFLLFSIKFFPFFLFNGCCFLLKFTIHICIFNHFLFSYAFSFLYIYIKIFTLANNYCYIFFCIAFYIFYFIICYYLYRIRSLVYLLTAEWGLLGGYFIYFYFFYFYYCYNLLFYKIYFRLFSYYLLLINYNCFRLCSYSNCFLFY